jgi:hypothetical protein
VARFADQIQQWHRDGIQGTTIHQALVRNHGFTGSYSAVRRFLQGLEPTAKATSPLEFKPGELAQVDFGAVSVATVPDGDPGISVHIA